MLPVWSCATRRLGARNTGQTLDEWLGAGWVNAIRPEDRQYAERQWHEAVGARKRADFEYRLRHAGGGWRWTNVQAAPLIDPDGTVRKWVGMNIDISERKTAEQALRESEEKYRTLFNSIDEGFCITEVLFDEIACRSRGYPVSRIRHCREPST